MTLKAFSESVELSLLSESAGLQSVCESTVSPLDLSESVGLNVSVEPSVSLWALSSCRPSMSLWIFSESLGFQCICWSSESVDSRDSAVLE